MKLIMENWRAYMKEAEAELQLANIDADNVKIYLFENNSSSPTGERLLSEVVTDYEKGLINEQALFAHVHETIDYEHRLLMQEGIPEILKAPIEKFANTKVAIAAKAKARKTASIAGAKAFTILMKTVKAATSRASNLEGQVLSLMKDQASKNITSEKAQSGMATALKIHQTASKMIVAAIKGLVSLAKKIITTILSVFNHPLIRIGIPVICVAILALAAINSSIFVGSLAAAPAFAVSRLGIKGATKAFGAGARGAKDAWDMIPNKPAATNEGEINYSHDLLTEDEQVLGIIAQALSDIMEAIPEGSTAVDDVSAISTMTMQSGGDTAREVNTEMAMFIRQTDAELSDSLQAAEQLASALQSATGQANMEQLMSTTQMIDEGVASIIQRGLQTAQKACELDPEMCAASRILAEEFQLVRASVGETLHESESVMQQIRSGAGEVDWTADHWQREVTNATDVHAVADNPFYDPGAVDDMPDPNDPGKMVRDRSREISMRGSTSSVDGGPVSRSWETETTQGGETTRTLRRRRR